MKILVTGSKGFVGKNLIENLKNIKDGKNATRQSIQIEEIYQYDKDETPEQLDMYCSKADFIFHLAGINRPDCQSEFITGNVDFLKSLLSLLKSHNNNCPIMLSSSIQASMTGRFEGSEYGRSKKEGEDILFQYAEETGASVYIYRFPNLAGKWIRPNYNSAVGTFCHNIANDIPIVVNDPDTELELLFIDDLLEEMYDLLEGNPHRCDYPKKGPYENGKICDGITPIWNQSGKYCGVPITHKVTLRTIVSCLNAFHDQPRTLLMPTIGPGTFEKKLYSMYLSYLPKEKVMVNLKMNCDERGSFTELLKTVDHGQFSLNISKPGITKGEHWHNTKWEYFIVVSGHGLIRERKIGTDEIMEFEVSGDKIQAVHMLPGYTHNIINLSDRENLVTLMWANELFDPNHPDTFHEPVVI